MISGCTDRSVCEEKGYTRGPLVEGIRLFGGRHENICNIDIVSRQAHTTEHSYNRTPALPTNGSPCLSSSAQALPTNISVRPESPTQRQRCPVFDGVHSAYTHRLLERGRQDFPNSPSDYGPKSVSGFGGSSALLVDCEPKRHRINPISRR